MPANDSLRLMLLEAVGQHLYSTIKIANGYTHDLVKDNMRIGAQFLPTGTRLPFICVFEHINANPDQALEGSTQVGGNDDPALLYTVKFDISGSGPTGDAYNPAGPTYELMADVKKACGLLDQYIKDGELFYGVPLFQAAHDPGAVLPQSSVEQRTLAPMFIVQLGLQIVESAADPYRLTD
jgi:hypothetical protein